MTTRVLDRRCTPPKYGTKERLDTVVYDGFQCPNQASLVVVDRWSTMGSCFSEFSASSILARMTSLTVRSTRPTVNEQSEKNRTDGEPYLLQLSSRTDDDNDAILNSDSDIFSLSQQYNYCSHNSVNIVLARTTHQKTQ